jgi:hypothetical protein
MCLRTRVNGGERGVLSIARCTPRVKERVRTLTLLLRCAVALILQSQASRQELASIVPNEIAGRATFGSRAGRT